MHGSQVMGRKIVVQKAKRRRYFNTKITSTTEISEMTNYTNITATTEILSEMINFGTCCVCFEDGFLIDATACCTHPPDTCKDCMANYIRSNYGAGVPSHVICPYPKCGSVFGVADLKKFILKTELLKWENNANFREIEKDPHFMWCAKTGCGYGGIVDTEYYSFFTCKKCNTRTCCRHRTVMHENISCDEYDEQQQRNAEKESEKYLKTIPKSCPLCHVKIERDGGCSHIKCVMCQYEFCWKCLADHKKILAEGNHFHKSTCKFYRPWIQSI